MEIRGGGAISCRSATATRIGAGGFGPDPEAVFTWLLGKFGGQRTKLKDRLDDIETLHTPAPSTDDRGDRLRSDVLSALQNLGYHRPLAEAAVDAALPGDDRATFEDVLKAALRELMR